MTLQQAQDVRLTNDEAPEPLAELHIRWHNKNSDKSRDGRCTFDQLPLVTRPRAGALCTREAAPV